MSLQKSLPRIAAKVLHNTHVGLSQMKEKFELIEVAYGRGDVEVDFEKWCQENKERNPKYPLTEYVKVVDSRMGPKFSEESIDSKDPRISEIAALSYELTSMLPSSRSISSLLSTFPLDEIVAALREYVLTLEEKEFKTSMRTFFSEGNAGAVILARRRRSQHV